MWCHSWISTLELDWMCQTVFRLSFKAHRLRAKTSKLGNKTAMSFLTPGGSITLFCLNKRSSRWSPAQISLFFIFGVLACGNWRVYARGLVRIFSGKECSERPSFLQRFVPILVLKSHNGLVADSRRACRWLQSCTISKCQNCTAQ